MLPLGTRSNSKSDMSLEVRHLSILVDEKEIVRDLSLVVEKGSVHAIMGPNGSGKSTLANAVMGHPKYTITSGQILLDTADITEMKVTDRARKGLFLSLQYPPHVEGVTVSNFLRTATNALRGDHQNPIKFHKALLEKMIELSIDQTFATRYLNVGFSGGEKKRMEILQLLILNPAYAILDETDSGLDVDALKIVAEGINRFRGAEHGILLITHYNRILQYVRPDFVHIIVGGRIVESGGAELAERVEKEGYTERV